MFDEMYRVERWKSEEAPDEGELRSRLEAEGYGVFRWSDSPGAVYATHSHGNDQSHWVISGCMEFVVDGDETVRLNAGDRDFMPAGTDHSARVVGDEPVVYLIGAKGMPVDRR